MVSELDIIYEDRKCEDDIISLTSHITKMTDELVYRYAKENKLDYDVALELLVRLGSRINIESLHKV